MITRLLGLVHIFRCGGGAKYIWESRPPGLPRAPRGTPQPLERTGIPPSRECSQHPWRAQTSRQIEDSRGSIRGG